MIGFYEFWGMYLISWFPHIVTFGVALPFREVLECFGVPMMLVAADELHLVFCFSFNKVRWWSGEVGAVSSHFAIGR